MKLQLQGRRGGPQEEQQEEVGGDGAAPGPAWAPPETQDFQEYLAENERAVLHLQTAERLDRLQAEEGEGGGLCVLGEHLDGTAWQVKPPLCPPGLVPSPFPPGSPVLGFPPEQPAQGGGQVGSQVPAGPPWQVQPQVGGEGGNGPEEPPAPTCSPPGEDLGVPPAPPAESEGGAPQSPPEHLEHLEHPE
ncbi:CSRN2 protein, partial [Tyrannus savana]|nr:CSRN2 protein [Tyrannus savana]